MRRTTLRRSNELRRSLVGDALLRRRAYAVRGSRECGADVVRGAVVRGKGKEAAGRSTAVAVAGSVYSTPFL